MSKIGKKVFEVRYVKEKVGERTLVGYTYYFDEKFNKKLNEDHCVALEFIQYVMSALCGRASQDWGKLNDKKINTSKVR